MADARKARCVLAEVRWRWTLKVLYVTAWVERNLCADPMLLNPCILRSLRRVGRCEFSARLLRHRPRARGNNFRFWRIPEMPPAAMHGRLWCPIGLWQDAQCCAQVLNRSALARSNGHVLDRLNQTTIIISTARHVDTFRDRPYTQKVIWCGPQQLDACLSGKPSIQDRADPATPACDHERAA
jgi:hypothetical protein